MSTRPIAPLKRPNSANLWFRMIVPPDLRAAIGKREIRESLNTPHMPDARLLCSAKQHEWNCRFEERRSQIATTVALQGADIADQHLDACIAEHGASRAISYELEMIAQAEQVHLNSDELLDPGQAAAELCAGYRIYNDLRTREISHIRQQALHRSVTTAPVAGLEAVMRARAAGFWQVASDFLEEAFGAAGLPLDPADPRVRVAADHFLGRLVAERPPQLDTAIAAHPTPSLLMPGGEMAEDRTAIAPAERATADRRTGWQVDSAKQPDASLRRQIMGEVACARTLLDVFAAWAVSRDPEDAKLVDEWKTTISRFVELHGDLDVALITKDHVKLFREAMKNLPSRPKASLRELPLLEQIEVARLEGLLTLSGPTIAKHMSGVRVVLNYAVETLGVIDRNVAKEVKVLGSKSAVDVRKPHTPEELRDIFASPLMTDPTDRLRTTDFWLILMAPLMGIRIEEGGKLRPENVKIDRGIAYISIERDCRKKRREDHAVGKAAKRAKTSAAYRDIPIHWILIEAGFLEFVTSQRSSGAEWLFNDLVSNRHGDRTKAASQRILRRLRKLGIEDEEKVFHSFRHDMKRAARGTAMKEEIADLLTGHGPDNVGRRYGAGVQLEVLKNAVDMIDYELVDWDPVIAAANARVAGVVEQVGGKQALS